jgi:predicted transglutaminase-like cysteine proteinase
MAMRRYQKGLVLVTAIAALFCAPAAQAAFFGLPLALKFQLDQIHFGTPVLPPMGHSRFCLRYPGECEVEGIDLPRRDITLTPERWNELNTINREVNRDISPKVSLGSGATEEWLISPSSGDCKDYAVTKRHELLALGWPSRALLLSEVIVPSGEHHLILVVRTKDVDLVLDNLNANIRPVAMTYRQYQWIRIESPQNPKFWASVNMPGVIRTATAID